MTDRDPAFIARQQRPWPVVVRSLHDEPPDDQAGHMNGEARVELVWTLSARMWELTGRPFPSYARSAIPVRIQRGQ